MAQHDYVIANQGFPAFRSDLNDALAAVVSNNSGATEPSTMFAHQIWVDTAADPSILKIRNADNDAWITIGTINQTGDTFTLTSAVSATTLNTSGAVVFNDAGADVDFRVEGDTDANLLFVDASADRVGVGTSTPQNKLQVQTTVRPQFSVSYDGTTGLYLEDSTNSAWKSWKLSTAFGAGSDLSFVQSTNTSGTPTWAASAAMTLDASGNLLVGTTSGWFGRALVVETINDAIVAINNGVASWPISALNQATSGDNVFIGFWTEARATPTQRGFIDYNRGAGLTRYNTTSDATLKNIIGDSDGQKSLEILNSTRIREFAWKDDETQKPQIGVIAQELHETFKGAVSVGGDVEKQRDITEEVEEEYTDEDGNTQTRTVTRVTGQETYTEYRPWAVDKTAFTFHLVAGWQAHEKIIKQQADMIAALEARIAALEA